jgi:hypothetical protein
VYGPYSRFEEKSPTGAAHCRKCGELIKKGEPRLGEIYYYYRYAGYKYTHLKCVGFADIMELFNDIAKLITLRAQMEIKNGDKA